MLELEGNEAKRARRRRQQDDLDAERARDVGKRLDVLLAGVTTGSELLYDGLSASSLDGQPLALAIGVHLDRPAIPSPQTLLYDFCAAAGLCMERATSGLRSKIANLRAQAEAIGAAVERSQNFWRTMRDGLPEGCHVPLAPTCRWRRRAHCRHQDGRL